MPQLFKNSARALLASGITAIATTLTVEAGKADRFPIANAGTAAVPGPLDWFKLVLQDVLGNVEIVYVRTRTSGSAIFSNVIRGQEGTVARAWDAGVVCGLRITAVDIESSISAGVNALLTTGNQTSTGQKTFNGQIVAAGGLSGNVVGNVTGNLAGNADTASLASTALALSAAGSAGDGATATTQAVKDATTKFATTAFVDRMRSLSPPATGASGTLTIGDRGALVQATGSVTVPSAVFAAGDVVTVVNNSASAISILQGSGLTLYLGGTATTGTRTVAQRGMITIVFLNASVGIISGGGLS